MRDDREPTAGINDPMFVKGLPLPSGEPPSLMTSIGGWEHLQVSAGGMALTETAHDRRRAAGDSHVTSARQLLDALRQLADGDVPRVVIERTDPADSQALNRLLVSDRMLRDMPDGVALIDDQNRVLWANQRLLAWTGRDSIDGMGFYQAFDEPEIVGPDFCPFHTALATLQCANSTLQTRDNRFFQVHAAPLRGEADDALRLIVTVNDVTEEVLQQQKLAAIHRAGRQLADLRPEEIFLMEVDDRIHLLKDNIRHYLQDLLNYDVIELRLLDHATGTLVPLLSVGLDQEACDRQLHAHSQGNGVTGFVAATAKSYLCEDTANDPLYIPGIAAGRSSLTVPLMLQDQVLGTINVESPEPHAFSASDVQFLEIFARDVAHALNTLELLVAQKANTAQQSCEAIHSAVALPVDEILNDVVNVMECYIGHEPQVVDRLRRILRNARDIKQVIHQVGQKLTPMEAVPADAKQSQHSGLRGRRVLVVDADEGVRNDAHALLERYGCIVETAHDGQEAMFMVRSSGGASSYNVIISDIRLPDFSGYQLMCRLQEIMTSVPMVLMTGFGYDPGHSIVKARQAGLHPKAVLYKPFLLDQLLDVIETIVDLSAANESPLGATARRDPSP
jgi:two-component system, sensor histidine kinase SagS